VGVKIFLGTIGLTVLVTITGFAYWFFPILSNFHEAMGGGPLKNPSGDFQQQLDTWLSFLPGNTVGRAAIIAGIIAGYMLFTGVTTMVALRWRRRREDRALQRLSRAHAAHAVNARR
jgi:hypothetical protein